MKRPTPAYYRTKLQDLTRKLGLQIERRAQADFQIGEVSERIRALCAASGTPLPIELQRNPAGRAGGGLTAGIREMFNLVAELTASDIHDALVISGKLDVKKYRNSQSVIHNTLRRMVKQGELVTAMPAAGSHKTVYRKAHE